MDIGLSILSFILGAIIGSFLNVIVFRLGNGVNKYHRSQCLSCGHKLSVLDMIPIFGFLFLGGRCRYCHSKVSWQYFWVELSSAIIFTLIFLWSGILQTAGLGEIIFVLFGFVIFAVLLALTVYDIRHKIVPLSLSIPLIALSLCYGVISVIISDIDWNCLDIFFRFLDGVLLATPFFLLWLTSGGRWIGLGDFVLLLGIGWLLGLSAGVTATILAFWIATALFLVICLPALFWFDKKLFNMNKNSIMKAEMPMVPFLALATLIVFLTQINFFQIALL